MKSIGFSATLQTDGTIRLHGAGTRKPATSLPPVGYTLQIQLADARLETGRWTFRIPENGQVELDVRLKEPKVFSFVGDVNLIDTETRDILEDERSVLDGMPALDWLRRGGVRAVRKVCLLNCLAKLRTLPRIRESLSSLGRAVLFADVDRAAIEVEPDFLKRLLADSRSDKPSFTKDSGILHETHRRMLARMVGDRAPAYKLHSFRQNVGKFALQIVVAEPNKTVADGLRYAELDVDLGNPFVDAVGFITHVGELLNPGRTNHYDIAEKVPKDFRYYSLS